MLTRQYDGRSFRCLVRMGKFAFSLIVFRQPWIEGDKEDIIVFSDVNFIYHNRYKCHLYSGKIAGLPFSGINSLAALYNMIQPTTSVHMFTLRIKCSSKTLANRRRRRDGCISTWWRFLGVCGRYICYCRYTGSAHCCFIDFVDTCMKISAACECHYNGV